MNKIVIIGIAGRFGAGCTTTCKFFADQLNFSYFSLSQTLKDKAKKGVKDFNRKKEKEKREILQNLGDETRKKDLAALAKPIIAKIKNKNNNIIIDSIRNPEEVHAFRKEFKNFFLLAIDAKVV